MKKFKYKAINNKDKSITKGVLKANNYSELESILGESNYELIQYKEEKNRDSIILSMLSSITKKDIISVFIHLEQLEKASVPILVSLEDLKDSSENPKLRDMMQEIYESVKNGKMLSESMAAYPKIFNHLMVNLIKTGEEIGNLEQSFRNIVEHMKWSEEIKRKTAKAIRMPAFSLAVLFLVLIIMMKLVVPKVTGFIIDQGIPLPGYTTALLAFSSFFQKYFVFILASPFACFFTVKFLKLTSKTFRIWFDGFKLKWPLIGNIIQKLEISRFTHFFALTFSSGVPVLKCLSIAEDIMQNAYIKDEMYYIRKRVSNGITLSKSLSMSPLFPSLVLRMFEVGEQSGSLSEALNNVEYFYKQEANDAIDKIVGAIQPLLILVMGGMMSWIIAGVFGPLYGSFGQMGGL